MSLRGGLAGQTLLLTFAQWLSLAVGFFATVLITRALGPEGRGLYAWLLTLTGLAVQVAALAPAQTVRGIAGELGDEPAFVPTLMALSLFGTLLGLPVFAYAWAELPGEARGVLLFVAWAAVPLTAAAVSIIAFVQIEQRVWPILWAHLGPKLALLVGAGALWASDRLDVGAAVWLNTLVAVVQLGLLLLLLPSRPASRPSFALARRVAGLIGAGWVAALALFAVPRASLILLGSLGMLAEVGQYSVALALFEILIVLPVAASGVLTTHLLRSPEARPGWRGGLRLAGLMAVISLVALALAPVLVPFLFGAVFRPAAGAFQGLLAAVMLGTIYQYCQGVLQARGQASEILLPPVLALLVSLPVAWLAVPRLGAEGAVIGTIVGYAVLAGAAALLARRPGTDLSPAR
jgi:O-antigen/teichoic acid export membrane protein